MQYTVSMSSRMLAIAAFCVFLLCVLLFLLGIELGKRFAEPTMTVSIPTTVPSTPSVTAPSLTAPSVTAPSVTAPAVTAPAVAKP